MPFGRLREALQDELFVRTPKGMEPTARALAMAPVLREALRSIHDTLGVQPFDPASTARSFVVAADDYVTSVLLTRLAACLGEVAPAIDLVVRPSTRLDLAEQIDVGRIDIALGIFAEVPARFQSARLWLQEDVSSSGAGHASRGGKAHIADLARLPFTDGVAGRPGGGRGRRPHRRAGAGAPVGDVRLRALEARWLRPSGARATGSPVPHSLTVPDLLAGSDMVSIVSGAAGAGLRRPGVSCWQRTCPMRPSGPRCAPSGIGGTSTTRRMSG